MSARRSRWCSPIRPASPRMRVGLIEVDIEPLPAVADRHVSAKNETLLFEDTGHQSARSSSAPCAAMPRRRSRTRPICGARASAPSGTWRCRWSRAACWPNGMRRAARLTVSGARQGAVLQPPHAGEADWTCPKSAIEIVENDVGGGFGARGEFYPEDFLIPFAARHDRPAREMDRGPPRASHDA